MSTTRRRWRKPLVAAAAVTGLLLAVTSGATANLAGVASITGDTRVDGLLAQMTLDEKIAMIEGVDDPAGPDKQYQAGYLAGVPRLGIPSLKLADGPPGVITRQDSTGMTSTMGLAATFSEADANSNGVVIGRDGRALGQDILLQPLVNIDRDTSFWRGFNTFGEDPVLTGRMGANVITGVQSQGVMAQVKHYVGYDGAGNVSVDPQTLHEVYLRPFSDAVQAGVSSVMCAYNAVNNAGACGSAPTQLQILRNELGFTGFVTSDWGGNHGVTYLGAGLDMEMPGSGTPGGAARTAYFAASTIKRAIATGAVQQSRIDEAAGRVLLQMERFGLLDGQSKHTVTALPTGVDEPVVLKTAQDAATLLKNAGGVLPLSSSARSKLVLIGPGAGQTFATNSGREAAGGLLSQQVSPLATLRSAGASVTYAVGDDVNGTVVPASALSQSGQPGLLRKDTTTNTTVVVPTVNSTTAAGTALVAGHGYTYTGTLTAAASGNYWLNIQSLGGTAGLFIDGTKVVTAGTGGGTTPRYGVVHVTDGNTPNGTPDGLANGRVSVPLSTGAHTLKVVETPDVSGRPVQVRFNWVTPGQTTANHDTAVAAARNAAVAVVFAWDTTGGDLSAPLPDGQDQLISDVAAANPNTVVVLQANQPIAMPWLGKVKAVLDVWYGGDQAGVAAADVLLGTVDPAGRLPFTWPATLSQELAHQPAHPERTSAGVHPDGTPCTGSFTSATPDLGCLTTYSEGVDVGYRYYDATNETPLFPFGYGLSYTTFSYSGLATAFTSGGGLDVTFSITNTGTVAGDEVPQVYLGKPASAPAGVQFAPFALAGFTRVSLAAGASTRVTVHVPPRQFQYWSEATGWTTATGSRPLAVGPSERSRALTTSVVVG